MFALCFTTLSGQWCVFNLCFASIGSITSLSGKANIQRENKNIEAFVGSKIEEKDIIETNLNSKVKIKLNDNTLITIGKNSALNIEDYVYDMKTPTNSKTNLNFFKGAFKTITGQIGKINPDKFKLKTKTATIGIRGTVIVGNQTKVTCIQGEITVYSFGQEVSVKKGQITNTKEGKAPSTPKNYKKEEIKELESEIGTSATVNSVVFSTQNSVKEGSDVNAKSENGTVIVNSDGTVEYTPDENFEGSDTIIVEIIDEDIITIETIIVSVNDFGEVLLSLESVTNEIDEYKIVNVIEDSKDEIIVSNSDGNLEIKSFALEVEEDANIQSGKLTVFTNSEDSILTYSLASDAPAGFVLNADGTYSFDATNGEYDSLNKGESKKLIIPVLVRDENGLSDTANIEINVLGNTELSGYQLGSLNNVSYNPTIDTNTFLFSGENEIVLKNDNTIYLNNYSLTKKLYNYTAL